MHILWYMGSNFVWISQDDFEISHKNSEPIRRKICILQGIKICRIMIS